MTHPSSVSFGFSTDVIVVLSTYMTLLFGQSTSHLPTPFDRVLLFRIDTVVR
jgi:hypothetical protein